MILVISTNRLMTPPCVNKIKFDCHEKHNNRMSDLLAHYRSVRSNYKLIAKNAPIGDRGRAQGVGGSIVEVNGPTG